MAEAKARRIVVLGLRGIPSIAGGIETHVRMLCPLLVRLGWNVYVVQRSLYFPRSERRKVWHGIRLLYIWAPKILVVETAFHTLFGILYAGLSRPRLLHLHGIGPGFLVPMARLFGLKVVITHHTFDYKREKWGYVARTIFNVGEYLSMKYSNGIICVTADIQKHILDKYQRQSVVIPNGARVHPRTQTTSAIERLGIVPNRYVLSVARFESTKRHHDLIDAFERADTGDWRLVLVGSASGNDSYTRGVVERTRSNPSIVLVGYQSGLTLRELYSWAGLFVLCSSHEGQPIAVLEALSYGIPTVVTSIPANESVPLSKARFFAVGDVAALAILIESSIRNPEGRGEWSKLREVVRRDYSWKHSARLTHRLYQEVLGR